MNLRRALNAAKVRLLSNKDRVLREYPSAWFNSKERTIEGYSEGLILGRGSVLARNIEKSAWLDAVRNLRRVSNSAKINGKLE